VAPRFGRALAAHPHQQSARAHHARVPAPDARRRSVFRTARVPSTALPPSDRGITDPEKAKDLWTQPMPQMGSEKFVVSTRRLENGRCCTTSTHTIVARYKRLSITSMSPSSACSRLVVRCIQRLGRSINVGSAKEYHLLDIAHAVRAAAGANIHLRVGCAPERPAEIQQLVCNSDKARVLLGWVAQTDFKRAWHVLLHGTVSISIAPPTTTFDVGRKMLHPLV